MPHFRYVGTHERIHLGPPARMINYGDIVAARTNPDSQYFELVDPDQLPENGNAGRRAAPARAPTLAKITITDQVEIRTPK